MFMLKNLALVSVLAASISSAYAVDQTLSADRQNIDNSCKAEASTAGCGADQVGTGLLKCLHAYKKANPSFSLSPGCKAAMQQLHADKKAGK